MQTIERASIMYVSLDREVGPYGGYIELDGE